ncbi:hypothetical protein [Mesorhizobium sp. IMUNJ 23232]|uniref:hypothetical protein n=1 Tax=Mesorhizobium sp. IMUNJ 23232 TaxID=3376064 RepID=UPI0037924EBE
MIEVVQAFDRAHIAALPTDDASALETKLATARALPQDRAVWSKRNDHGECSAVPHALAVDKCGNARSRPEIAFLTWARPDDVAN